MSERDGSSASASNLAPISLIPQNTRYKNLEDLQSRLGVVQLDSYIVPELKEISASIRDKKIQVQKKNEIKDEFEQMVNWKRVFEQIW